MPYYKKEHDLVNGVYHARYREKLKEAKPHDSKSRIRAEIDDQVFDIYDSVADNAKWASILTIAISIIYNSLDEQTKARMDPRQKALMDLLVAAYANATTRFEAQYQDEGVDLILKMLDRQKTIGAIITKNKGKK